MADGFIGHFVFSLYQDVLRIKNYCANYKYFLRSSTLSSFSQGNSLRPKWP